MSAVGVALLLAGWLQVSCSKSKPTPTARCVEPEHLLVRVAYPGASPAEVESHVIMAIESTVRSVAGVSSIRSNAREGQAMVAVYSQQGTSLDQMRADVMSALERARSSMPAAAEMPYVQRVSPARPTVALAVHGDISVHELIDVGWRVRNALLSEPGFQAATPSSMPGRELEIMVDEKRLQAHGLSLDELRQTLQRDSLNLPGGSVRPVGGEVLLRTSHTRLDVEHYRDLPVGPSGLKLGDLAQLRWHFGEPLTTRIDGRPAIIVQAVGRRDITPIELLRKARGLAVALQQGLPDSVQVEVLPAMTTNECRPAPVGGLSRPQLQGAVVVQAQLPAGSAQEEHERVLAEIEEAARRSADGLDIRLLSAGRGARLPLSGWPPGTQNTLQVAVLSPTGQDDSALARRWQEQLRRLPGISFVLHDSHTHSLAVQLIHPDLSVLNFAAIELRRLVQGFAGASALPSNGEMQPQLSIESDRARAVALGVPVEVIARTVRAAVSGHEVARLHTGREEVPVMLRVRDPLDMHDVEELAELSVPTPDGGRVPLMAIAEISVREGPQAIDRLDGQRSAFVSMAVPAADAAAILAALRDKLLPALQRKHAGLTARLASPPGLR